jgi:dihydroorotate dehydrogenase electron transfer subunit
MNSHSCTSSSGTTHRMIRIVENVPIARDTFRLRLNDPALARAIRPGQFVMVRPGVESAACDSSGTPESIDVVYLVVGRGTAMLALRQPGERVAVWGPLGNGFGPPPNGSVLFVAGGIGQTPFLALGRSWLHRNNNPASSSTLLYGVRTAALLAGIDDFRQAGIAVELATDDGTAGHHGFVTELLARRLEAGERPAKVVGCGPPAMLSALAKLVITHRISCDVSLENHMACGFGACFSCVAPIRQDDGSIDLRRVCVEGPVVPAERVDWAAMAH